MSYSSQYGRKPNEYASKSSHSFVVSDPVVAEFLDNCDTPKSAEEIDVSQVIPLDYRPSNIEHIENIIACDGGYTEATVKKQYPSAQVAFFQQGALQFKLTDLEGIDNSRFIDPKDMAKLKQIQRLKLVLPLKNVVTKGSKDFSQSVRKTLFDYFVKQPDDNSFITTLKWFLFEEYALKKVDTWTLSRCPNEYCNERDIAISREKIDAEFQIKCPKCGEAIYLTDTFRLHEAIDNTTGSGGVLGYLDSTLTQILIIHWIRLILLFKPSLLSSTFFIKDGPLSFVGQTANLHKPMSHLINFLADNHNINLVGIEKSGPFVEHANQVKSLMKNNSFLILNNEYIYNNILPQTGQRSDPYGNTTYYGSKIIFKHGSNDLYVLTVPVHKLSIKPTSSDFINLDAILTVVSKLRCNMYDNALIPVSLVNKLVSLSQHPSSAILEKFARNHVNL